jgi:hypothetical protein
MAMNEMQNMSEETQKLVNEPGPWRAYFTRVTVKRIESHPYCVGPTLVPPSLGYPRSCSFETSRNYCRQNHNGSNEAGLTQR